MRFFLRQDRFVMQLGFTLIEVLAALVLLSILLVGIVSARNQYIRQSHVLSSKQNAIIALDELLGEWWNNDKHIISAGQRGSLIDKERIKLDWQVKPVQRLENMPEKIQMRIVRLEVVDKNLNDEVILFVDLFISDLSILQKVDLSTNGNVRASEEVVDEI